VFEQNYRRDAMLRVLSPIGFDLIFTTNSLVLNHGFLGLQDFTDDR
jgi:hypothetical protein